MEIFKLFGSIMVDSAEANKSIAKTGEGAEKMGKKVAESAKAANGLGKKLSEGLKTAGKWAAGLTAAATAVGTAMVAAAKGAASDLDVIDKGSQRMGLTAERYQELAYAAGLCGVEMGSMEEAAKKLAGKDISMDQVLQNIMSIEDEATRTQTAIDYFGESAYKLTPLLNAGTDGLREMTEEAHALGLVMSADAVSAGAEMNDMFSKVSASVKAAGQAVMVDLFPFIKEILEWVMQNIPRVRDTIAQAMKKILPVVMRVMDAIMQALPPLLDVIFKTVDALLPVIEPVLGIIGNAVVSLTDRIAKVLPPILEVFTSVVEALLPLLEPVLDVIGAAVSATVAAVSALMPPIVEVFKAVADALMPILTPVLEAIRVAVSAVTAFIQAAIDFIQPYLEPYLAAIQALINGVLALIHGDIAGFFEGIVAYFTGMISIVTDLGKRIFTGLWDGMKSVWAGVSSWVEGVVSSITDWFSGIGARIAGFFGFGGDDTDGSHAAGLPTVPYDGYKAQLHRGETVLNANDTSRLAELLQSGSNADSAPVNITIQNVLDGKVIGQYCYQYNRRKARALG